MNVVRAGTLGQIARPSFIAPWNYNKNRRKQQRVSLKWDEKILVRTISNIFSKFQFKILGTFPAKDVQLSTGVDHDGQSASWILHHLPLSSRRTRVRLQPQLQSGNRSNINHVRMWAHIVKILNLYIILLWTHLYHPSFQYLSISCNAFIACYNRSKK